MENKKIPKIVLTIAAAAVIAFALYCHNVYMETKAYEFCREIAEGHEWVKYSMLSKELKELISEEEFNSTDPEVQYRMYKKMENRVVDKSGNFEGSTHFFKTPYVFYLHVDGKSYGIEPHIDAKHRFNKIEVRNFYCEIFLSR